MIGFTPPVEIFRGAGLYREYRRLSLFRTRIYVQSATDQFLPPLDAGRNMFCRKKNGFGEARTCIIYPQHGFSPAGSRSVAQGKQLLLLR